jgi:hypothetical protein
MKTSLQSIIEVLNRDANPLQQHAQSVKHSLLSLSQSSIGCRASRSEVTFIRKQVENSSSPGFSNL